MAAAIDLSGAGSLDAQIFQAVGAADELERALDAGNQEGRYNIAFNPDGGQLTLTVTMDATDRSARRLSLR